MARDQSGAQLVVAAAVLALRFRRTCRGRSAMATLAWAARDAVMAAWRERGLAALRRPDAWRARWCC